MFNDSVKATGKPRLTLYDEFGNIKAIRHIDNLVVTTGKQYIAAKLSTSPPTAMGWIALGTGTTIPVIADTALQTEISTRTACTSVASGAVITYSATIGAGVATGALTEAGIFNLSTLGGTMLAHTTFPVVNKASGDTIVVTWAVTIQ